MQIGAADARRFDSDEYIARLDGGYRDIHQLKAGPGFNFPQRPHMSHFCTLIPAAWRALSPSTPALRVGSPETERTCSISFRDTCLPSEAGNVPEPLRKAQRTSRRAMFVPPICR